MAPIIHVRSDHPAGTYSVRCLRESARKFRRKIPDPGELSILITTDRAIAKINGEWRDRRQPTDVLSFPGTAKSGALGDVVISLDTARRQAREMGHPLSAELARLLAHGMLHLIGHDHLRPAEARRMAKAEERLLGRSGLVGVSLAASSGL